MDDSPHVCIDGRDDQLSREALLGAAVQSRLVAGEQWSVALVPSKLDQWNLLKRIAKSCDQSRLLASQAVCLIAGRLIVGLIYSTNHRAAQMSNAIVDASVEQPGGPFYVQRGLREFGYSPLERSAVGR